MDLDKQKRISERFDRLFKSGTTPWKAHKPEPSLEDFIKTLKEKKPDAKVLDIGCGDGWVSIGLAKLGFSVWGIDSSETAIKRAKERAEKESVDVDFRVGNALNLPYEDSFFDAMVDRGLLHHILPENREKYFENILRVLKKDALVFLSVFSTKNPEGIGERFTPELVEKLFEDNFEILKNYTDPWPTDNPAHLHHFILKRQN